MVRVGIQDRVRLRLRVSLEHPDEEWHGGTDHVQQLRGEDGDEDMLPGEGVQQRHRCLETGGWDYGMGAGRHLGQVWDTVRVKVRSGVRATVG